MIFQRHSGFGLWHGLGLAGIVAVSGAAIVFFGLRMSKHNALVRSAKHVVRTAKKPVARARANKVATNHHAS
jgi:hypothetical protein